MAEKVMQEFKVLIIGDTGVGKTSILKRFVENEYDNDTFVVIVSDINNRIIDIDGNPVKLKLYDTGGEERFREVTSSYYREADGVLLVYDITKESSFNNIERWKKEAETKVPEKIICVVAANKVDLASSKREVSLKKGITYADEHSLQFWEVSALSSENIQELFIGLTRQMITKRLLSSKSSRKLKIITGDSEDERKPAQKSNQANTHKKTMLCNYVNICMYYKVHFIIN